jgi:hypothetical protein
MNGMFYIRAYEGHALIMLYKSANVRLYTRECLLVKFRSTGHTFPLL